MKHLIPTLAVACSLLGTTAAHADGADTTPADKVDLERYLGEWHEAARFDNIFERGLHAVSALYEKLEDGTLRVTNTGTARDGQQHEAIGKARRQEGEAEGALEVSFVPPYTSFFSDYRILYVTPDYSGALVSDADGDNLWLLERSEGGDPDVLDELLQEAERRGFDTGELIYSSPRDDADEAGSEAEINAE